MYNRFSPVSRRKRGIHMNKKLIWSLVAVLLAIMILATGCQKADNETVPASEPTPEVVEFAEVTDAPQEEAEVASEEVAGEVAEETVQATVDTPAPETLLCTINGKTLTYGDIQPYIESLVSMYVNEYGYDSGDPELINYSNQAGMYFAQQYVILDELGAELSVTFTAEDEEAARASALTYWQEVLTYYEEAYYGVSEASTEEEKSAARTGTLALLESMGYTEDSFIAEEVDSARFNKITEAVCKDITVTDAELDEYITGLVNADKEMYSGDDVSYYEMMNYYGYPTYYKPEGYRAVLHVLLPVDETLLNNYNDLVARYEEQQDSEPVEGAEVSESAEPEVTAEPVTAEQIEAARQAVLASVQPAVDEIMEKYNTGTPFADLVAEYGTDPGMQQEGALEAGYEVAATSMIWEIPFRDGAMSIESVGGVSEPVVGSRGVHIIYYLRDVPGGAVEFSAEEREEIRTQILSERQNELLDTTIGERMAAAEIIYTDEAAPYIPVLEEEAADESAGEASETVIGGADEPTGIELTEETPAE